jgi:hypothetical protein
MVCFGSCLIASALLGASLIYLYPGAKEQPMKLFALLDDHQKELYKAVVMERYRLYVIGGLIGLLIGGAYLYMNPKGDKMRICSFVAIVLGVQVLYYSVMPKSTYMTYHLKTTEQIQAWQDTYKSMKTYWMTGLGLGAVAYLIFAYGYFRS